MIPRAYITAWRAEAPWPTDAQVEQDLVLSRALTDIFGQPRLADSLAFRGGTALHKLHFNPPMRYSEDVDLVQTVAGGIGPVLDGVREVLDPWLGEPRRRRSSDSVALLYRFDTTAVPVQSMRLKVEINTREHFSVRGFVAREFGVNTPWHRAQVGITTYELEELLGTKLRALYQRKKGRDLYDLWLALTALDVDTEGVIGCFSRYMAHGGATVSRAVFEANVAEKLTSSLFRDDVAPLLREAADYDVDGAAALVLEQLISRVPGEPWKGSWTEDGG